MQETFSKFRLYNEIDASYQYLVNCKDCQKTLGKIDWNDDFLSN